MNDQALIDLVNNSISLSIELKQMWSEKIPELTDDQKQQLAEIFANEQQAQATATEQYLDKAQQINNEQYSATKTLEKEFNRADLNEKNIAERKSSEQKAEDILSKLDEI